MTATATAAAVVSILGSAFYTERTLRQEKKAQKRANALANEQAAIEREAQEAALKEEQRKNRNLLAQQQSAYKAKLGASGLSAQTGSSQVVLDAMQNEADMEDKYLVNQKNFSLQSLNNRLQQTNNRNLLALNKLRLSEQKNVFDATTRLATKAATTSSSNSAKSSKT